MFLNRTTAMTAITSAQFADYRHQVRTTRFFHAATMVVGLAVMAAGMLSAIVSMSQM